MTYMSWYIDHLLCIGADIWFEVLILYVTHLSKPHVKETNWHILLLKNELIRNDKKLKTSPCWQSDVKKKKSLFIADSLTNLNENFNLIEPNSFRYLPHSPAHTPPAVPVVMWQHCQLNTADGCGTQAQEADWLVWMLARWETLLDSGGAANYSIVFAAEVYFQGVLPRLTVPTNTQKNQRGV